MAQTALVRVSGSVLSVPPARTGVFRADSARAGQTWSIENLNVLVADADVTAVQLPNRDGTGVLEGLNVREYTKGELVDFLCEVSVYRQDVQLRVVGLWAAHDSTDYLFATAREHATT